MIWLLDSNIVIHVLNGVLTMRVRLNAAADGDGIVASTTVDEELIYGAECSTRREKSRRGIRWKLNQSEVVPVTLVIADRSVWSRHSSDREED